MDFRTIVITSAFTGSAQPSPARSAHSFRSSLLRAEISRAFRAASADFSLTEVRGLFLALNAAFHPKPPVPFDIGGMSLGRGDVLGIDWIAANLVLNLAGMNRQLRPITRRGRPTGKDR